MIIFNAVSSSTPWRENFILYTRFSGHERADLFVRCNESNRIKTGYKRENKILSYLRSFSFQDNLRFVCSSEARHRFLAKFLAISRESNRGREEMQIERELFTRLIRWRTFVRYRGFRGRINFGRIIWKSESKLVFRINRTFSNSIFNTDLLEREPVWNIK